MIIIHIIIFIIPGVPQKGCHNLFYIILDSELRERIYLFYNDLCFFLFVSNILDSKKGLIFEISIFSDKKVNLVGTREVTIENFKLS